MDPLDSINSAKTLMDRMDKMAQAEAESRRRNEKETAMYARSMKDHEENLQKLIDLTKGGCRPVHQSITGLDEQELRFLAAMSYIKLHPAGNNEFYITVEKTGLAYFANKKAEAQPAKPLPVVVSLSESEHELQAEKEIQERAERKAERKEERKFHLLSAVLGAFAGSIFTLFFEHLGEIVEFLILLFR